MLPMSRVIAFWVLLVVGVSASEASLLSQQYTASWVSPDFFPLRTTAIRIGSIQNETGHEASFDILAYLKNQIRKELAEKGMTLSESDEANAIVIDLSVHLYQEGSTFGRWLGGGAGAAYAVVRASFRKLNQSAGADLLTVSVIGGGGLFSAGGEKTVLNDAAAVIGSFLKNMDNQ